MPLYRLAHDPSSPAVQPVREEDALKMFEVDQWSVENWKPIEVKPTYSPHEPKRPPGDLGETMPLVLSKKAVDALDDLLKSHGTLFELSCKEGSYYAFRVEKRPDTIDLSNESLAREPLFCLPAGEHGVDQVYVNEEFKHRVESCGLTGFSFEDPATPLYDWGIDEIEIPEKLTREVITRSSEANLYDLLYSYALHELGDFGEGALEKLPIGLRRTYAIQNLTFEVLNGGFHQYFWNSGGKLIPVVLDACSMVGAKKFASLVKEADEHFKKTSSTMEGYQIMGSVEAFSSSAQDEAFDRFDTQFTELAKDENLGELIVGYAKKHPADFLT